MLKPKQLDLKILKESNLTIVVKNSFELVLVKAMLAPNINLIDKIFKSN